MIGHLKHLIGRHTWIPYKAMEIYYPSVRICRYCNKVDWPENRR